ncbi:accessory gland protein Acp63F isoform X2 [Drosophila sechellia]|uniref:accessory gland protein Acp63F isoform X2 n=1 Tax=Drosophila sechellia TaxID=7238 RepID=UPI0013DDE0C4|nr:accessory gland protein Acp63F isoform X2 [Drosophila sechellia]
MKAILVFILLISTVQAKSKCSQVLHLNLNPHCGILPDCNFDGPNRSFLENVSCEREENGKPVMNIFETTSGKSVCEGFIKPGSPFCAFAASCNFQGLSLLHVGQEQCKLTELGKPLFLKIKAGRCPRGKPRCRKTR